MKRTPMKRSTSLRRDVGKATLSVRIPDAKPCSYCKAPFVPRNPMQSLCGPKCLFAEIRDKEKAERAQGRADRARLLDLKPLNYWEKRAERAVNRYVRLRDHDKGCCSCDKPATWPGKWNASHFRSVGAASAVRYHLWNIHKGCEQCNSYKSGNLSEYEPRLRARIGDAKVDWLRTQNQVVKRSRAYLERLHDVFARRCKRLEKKR